MSAPSVVTTSDGSVWVLHTVTRSGLALYAIAGSCSCPSYLLATLDELAVHGISGSADVWSAPVGPEPRTLDMVEDELTGANLSLYEEELESARLRKALASAQRGRRALRARVAELEAERHTTNEALDDAVQSLRAKEGFGDSYPPALPWAALMDDEDLTDFLDELAASAITHASSDVALAEVEKTCATWRLIAEAQHGHNTAPGPDAMTRTFTPVASLREDVYESPLRHDYRLGHDLPKTGGAK